MTNLTTLTAAGQIGPLLPEHGGASWMELFTHLMEEYKLRNQPFPHRILEGAVLPKPTFPSHPAAQGLVEKLKPFIQRPYVLKLGKARYLRESFETGVWRISPASTYSDPSLNFAQRDSELELTTFTLKSEIKLHIQDKITGELKTEIKPIGDIAVTSRSITDYYAGCFSKKLDLRLFDDFEADCCILIIDYAEFARRMFEAFKRWEPDWEGYFTDVSYLDPYNCKRDQIDLFFAKHFRYSYQHEVRFVWLPKEPRHNLDHIFVNLGDIKDICIFATL